MGAVKLFQLVLVGLLLSALPSTAVADELTRLYAQILRDPTNSDLNIRYAQLAEERGEPRKALAAYERILVNDPNNEEAQRGMQRIRRKLQPNTTQFIAELGALWESNPRRVSSGKRSEWDAIARLSLRDERSISGVRWRTLGTLIGEFHGRYDDLNYGYAGGVMGPVIDLTPKLAVHAALGGGVSYFANSLYYSEAVASLTFESFLEGAFRSVRFRGGYRVYDESFPSSEGFYADAMGKFAFPNVIGSGDLFIVSPWVRWSGIKGTGFSVFFPNQQDQPGDYIQYGAKFEYYRRIVEWLTIGGNFTISQRDYSKSTNIATGAGSERRDLYYVPGATLILHHVLGYQTDLRFDYRYEINESNFKSRDFENHLATTMLVSRF